jgi:hypothetical protein
MMDLKPQEADGRMYHIGSIRIIQKDDYYIYISGGDHPILPVFCNNYSFPLSPVLYSIMEQFLDYVGGP